MTGEKKLVLFGAGTYGEKWLKRLGAENVFCFAQSRKESNGEVKLGKEVIGISNLQQMKDDIIIFISMSLDKKREVISLLREKNLLDNVISSPYANTQLRVGINVFFDPDTEFEGNNYLGNNTRVLRSKMGFASYIASDAQLSDLIIGRYSAIGPRVSIIRGQHPSSRFVSVHPAFYSMGNPVSNLSFVTENIFEEHRYAEGNYAVKIGNDVWIGQNASIMEGITIGDGAIIAAGALVVKDVLPYMIVGGVPAKKIRQRFSEQEMEYLLKLKWWEKDEKWFAAYAKYFSDIAGLMEHVSV